MSAAFTLLLAVAGGIAVGSLYWAQPLLVVIADEFAIPIGTAGFLVTVTQIGYALGILLLVPLGDALNRRILIPATMTASALALASTAVAPGFTPLLVSLAFVGLLTTGGQMLPPLAGDLATPEQRGRVVGTIASGMLTGILLSRTISGFLADAFGWRAVFAMAALATLVMAAMIWKFMPFDRRSSGFSYAGLIRSVFGVVRHHPPVRATLLMGASVFAVFSMFWTGLTFLLSEAPFHYSLSQIGLVGIAGLAGAIAARNAGRLHDRGLSVPAQGGALVLTLASLVLAGLGSGSIVMILLAVVPLDAAIQAVNVLNQVRLMNFDPEARSRMNSAFVTSNCIGGALGSAVAGTIWPLGGWNGLITVACLLVVAALAIWMRWRLHFLAASVPRR